MSQNDEIFARLDALDRPARSAVAAFTRAQVREAEARAPLRAALLQAFFPPPSETATVAEYIASDHPPFQPDNPAGECDCCRYGPVPVIANRTTGGRQQQVDMCEVCYGTLVGIWATYPDVYNPTKTELGKLIAWGINHLKAQPPPQPRTEETPRDA